MPAGNRFRKLRAWISLASDVASYDTADDINARPDAPQNVGSSSWAGTSDRRNLLEAVLQSASPNSDTQVALGESTPVSSGDLDGWWYLHLFGQRLDRSTRSFGPLRDAVNRLIECIEIFELFTKTHAEYLVLRGELEATFQVLQHCTQDMSPATTVIIEGLCISIQNEVTRVKEKIGRGKFRKYIEADREADDVLACYRRIQSYLQRVTLNVDIQVWRIVDEIAASIELKRGPCTPGTRVELLSQMLDWADSSPPGSVYWMNGMAGTGKTTIAYSLCQGLEIGYKLAASFFCSRALPECRDVNRVIPSIAYQLARFSHPFRFALCGTLEKDPDIYTRLPRLQFDALIVRPLLQVKNTLPDSLVVIIDALDECENKDSTGRILEVLLTKSANLPVKFVVSSRPEPEVRNEMTKQNDQTKSRVVLHELDREAVQADIETYLRAKPTEYQIAGLVQRAGILFIYAATVVRYIGYNDFQGNTRARLANVLSSAGSTEKKHKEIDELYTTILRAALDNPELESTYIDDMRQVLHTVICAHEPLTVEALARLLRINDTYRIHATLRPLWSILHVSEASSLVTMLHASFADYMLDSSRSKQYHCDPKVHNQVITLRCFEIFRDLRPQFNICRLQSSRVPDSQVAGLEGRINDVITAELFYAARHWGVHICDATCSPNLVQELEEFLSVRLLLWMEVMSLKGCTGSMPDIVRLVEKSNVGGSVELQALIHDAWRFTTTFALGSISQSTPHIYTSMLPFWPSTSPISRVYTRRMNGMIKIEGTAVGQQQRALLATWHFDSITYSATFSPDGTQIAVGVGFDILLLSASTGQKVLPPFRGHSDPAQSVQFSHDGARIVSGSLDKTIRVWCAKTGEAILGPLEGHTDWIYSVAFSPDDTRIISGSRDETVRIWDTCTGDLLLGPLTGHHGWIRSVKYSLNGQFILSSGESKHLVIWDSKSGRVLKNLYQKDSGVSFRSADISPDGTRIVSLTIDASIHIWDITTSEAVLGPLTANNGRYSRFTSISFSPDGFWIVSSSQDRSVCMWDPQSGDLVLGPLEGHTGSITSVSTDKTLRLWDTHSIQGAPILLPGSADSVTSVGFSSDGARIVSASKDRNVCVWEVESGLMVFGPFQGFGSETLVTSPPSCTRIISKAEDGLVLTNTQSGSITLGPLQRYNWIRSAGLSSDGAYLALVMPMKNVIQILATDTGQTLMIIHPPLINSKPIFSTATTFSPDGTRIAVVSSNERTLSIYESHGGKLLVGPLAGYHSHNCPVGFSPDGSRIVSCSWLGIIVCDVQTGDVVVGPFEALVDDINSVEFSPDGNYIVSGADDNAVCVWDAQTGQSVFGPFKWHIAPVHSIRFSPDGTRVVSGSRDKTMRVTDISTGLRNEPNSLSSIAGEWVMNEDGWAVDSQGGLLFWVPPELRGVLMWPRTRLLISRKGWLRFIISDARLGSAWTECYRPALQ